MALEHATIRLRPMVRSTISTDYVGSHSNPPSQLAATTMISSASGQIGSISRRRQALALYKSILRAHEQYLPSQSMKQLGDAYVKAEFRLHKSAKAEQANLFFVEWEKYLQHIELTGRRKQSIDIGLIEPHAQQHGQQYHPLRIDAEMILSNPSSVEEQQYYGRSNNSDRVGSVTFGKDIPNEVVLSEDQVNKLEQLREEATKAAAENANAIDGNDSVR